MTDEAHITKTDKLLIRVQKADEEMNEVVRKNGLSSTVAALYVHARRTSDILTELIEEVERVNGLATAAHETHF